MRNLTKFSAVAVTACSLSLTMSASSQAQEWRAGQGYSHGYDIYQNPDGSYDSMSDLSRTIRGVPCGVECTRRAQARWARDSYR